MGCRGPFSILGLFAAPFSMVRVSLVRSASDGAIFGRFLVDSGCVSDGVFSSRDLTLIPNLYPLSRYCRQEALRASNDHSLVERAVADGLLPMAAHVWWIF